ncbi:MAG: hypothetical protein J5925_03835 [Clostridia bacterium]|nr:hypothetical protein [Clostridia bacterium]MBR5747010.1 hypothetical protein [Clostridia bacterium]
MLFAKKERFTVGEVCVKKELRGENGETLVKLNLRAPEIKSGDRREPLLRHAAPYYAQLLPALERFAETDLLAAAKTALPRSPETFLPFGVCMSWEQTYISQYNVSFYTEVSVTDGTNAEKTRRTQIWDRKTGQRRVFYDFFLPGADLYISRLISGSESMRRTDRELFVLRPGGAEFFRRENGGYSAFAVPFKQMEAEGLLRTGEI